MIRQEITCGNILLSLILLLGFSWAYPVFGQATPWYAVPGPNFDPIEGTKWHTERALQQAGISNNGIVNQFPPRSPGSPTFSSLTSVTALGYYDPQRVMNEARMLDPIGVSMRQGPYWIAYSVASQHQQQRDQQWRQSAFERQDWAKLQQNVMQQVQERLVQQQQQYQYQQSILQQTGLVGVSNSINNRPINYPTSQTTQTAQSSGQTRPAFDSSRLQTNFAPAPVSPADAMKKSLADAAGAISVNTVANEQLGQAIEHFKRANTHLSRGELKPALDEFDRARLSGIAAKDRAMEALSLRGQGVVNFAMGDLWRAIGYYRNARTLMREDGNRTGEAEIAASMGLTYQYLSEPLKALDNYGEALWLSGYPNNKAGVANILVGAGMAYRSLGDPQMTLKFYSLAFGAATNKAEKAGILSSVGELLHSHHYSEKAKDLYQEAFRLTEVDAGTNRTNLIVKAKIHASRTALLHSPPRSEMAMGLYQEVLRLMSKERNPSGDSVTLFGIGRVHLSLLNEAVERYEMALQAMTYYEEALTLMEEEENQAGEAAIYISAGRALSSLGFLDKALKQYNKALGLMNDDNQAGKAAAHASIGEVYFWKGLPYLQPDLFQKAVNEYQVALKLMEDTNNQAGIIGAKTSIGMVYDAWNKPKEALDYYCQAIEGLENMRTNAHLKEFKTSLAQQSVDVYQRAVLMRVRLKQRQEAFDLSESARARTFIDQLGNTRLDFRKDIADELVSRKQNLQREIIPLEKELEQAKMELGPKLDKEKVQSLEAQLTDKRKEYEDLLTRIRLSNPNITKLVSVTPLTLPDAQKLLDQETTLVSYFVTPEKALAFLITRESFRVVELSVTQRELEEEIEWFHPFPNLNDVPLNRLKQLYKWLIEPIKSHLKTPLVGIVPHGALHNLPFAALTDGKQYLGDNYTIFYLPSVSALRYIQPKQLDPQQPGGYRLLAVAYDKGDLPYAKKEAQAVAKLYGGDALVGDEATAVAIQRNVSKYDILHLISHYELNKTTPLFSGLILAPDKDAKASLEYHEVYGLDLKSADLVVLAVCQSNSGAQSRGDEITGLNRAFMSAGAPAVIASLWSVDDQATSELMVSFYTHLKGGMSKAAALRAAQSDTRAKYPHPFHWAAFVLTGDPGTTTASNSNRGVATADATATAVIKR